MKKKKGGRPKSKAKNRPVQTSLSPELYGLVFELAEEKGYRMSEIIREFIVNGVNARFQAKEILKEIKKGKIA